MVLESNIFVKIMPTVLGGIYLGTMLAWGVGSLWNSKFKKTLKEIDKDRKNNYQGRQK